MPGQIQGQSAQPPLSPDDSGIPPPRVANVPHVEKAFRGLDLSHDPGQVFPGFFTKGDNLRLRWGKLWTRPGFAGQLSAKKSAAIYAPTEYRNADGTTSLVYDSGGRVWKLAAGASSDAEITVPGAGTLNSAGAQYARLGRLFRVDGVAPLMAIDPTGGTTKLALNPPTTAPSAALTSTVLDGPSGAWTAAALSGSGQTNRLPNSDFSATTTGGGYGAGGGPTSWSPFGQNPDLGTPTNAAGNWLLLDNPGEGIVLTTALVNDAFSTDAARFASQFYAALTFWQSDPTAASTVILSVLGYSDNAGANLVAELTKEISVPFTGNETPVTVDTVFSFAQFGGQIQSYRCKLTAGAHNASVASSAGQPSVYVRYPVVFPFAPALVVTTNAAGTHEGVHQPAQITVGGGQTPLSAPGTVGMGRGAGGAHLIRDLSGGAGGNPGNWSGAERVTIGLAGFGSVQGLTLRLALRQDGTATRNYSNALTVSADGTYATVDLSTLPSAVLSSFRWVELILAGDFLVSGAGDLLFEFAPIIGAGNLSIDSAGISFAPYSYACTEIDRSGDATLGNVIESNPSPVSALVSPSDTQAQAVVVLPPPLNATTTDMGVYRFGGTLDGGTGRLIGIVCLTADTSAFSDAGLLTWNHTTRTLQDDTPDQWIEVTSAAVLDYGRNPAPVGATAVCAHQGRIWTFLGGRAYGSWLIQQNLQAALYFNRSLDPTDPLAKVKGDTFSVGQDDGDPVTCALSLGQNSFFSKGFLVVFKRSSVYLLGGTDPTNFYMQSYLVKAGIGCVGPGAAGIINGKVWFVSDDGVYEFDADFADPKSVTLERGLLAPSMQGGCSPAAWAKSAVVVHDRRFHVCVPTPGDSAPTVKYVWDSREQPPGGWTRDTGAAFTGGCTLSAGSGAGALYWAGQDGQIYQETGALDKGLSTDAGTGVAYAFATRGLGQEQEGMDYWRERQASWWMGEISTAQAGGQVTCGIVGEGVSWTEAHYLNAAGGLTHIRKDVPSHVRGRSLEVTLSGTATSQHEIQAVGAVTAAGSLR